MRAFVTVALLLALALRSALADPIPVVSCRRLPDGALLGMRPGLMKLQVCSDRVIRVVYSPTDQLPRRPSLAVIRPPGPADFDLRQSGGEITVAAANLQAMVSRRTGAVAFRDGSGRLLLQEDPGGGKVMSPARVAGEATYHATARFLLLPHEALFGLGQHRNNRMNQRGAEVTLRQVNMDVGVPVLISSRGYGVLWDNPSLTTVSCGAMPTTVIPAGNLLQPDGTPGGLRGEYFQGESFETLRHTRVDPTVDFDWRGEPAPGVAHDLFSVRWTGQVETDQAGDYQFFTDSDDGVRLWVDGKLVIDDWTVHPVKGLSARLRLAARTRYPIKMEYFQERGEAVARLSWQVSDPRARDVNQWRSEVADALDYYVLAGPEPDEIIASYRDLTGQAPLLPRWALGYWQCKERYASQAELLEVLSEYRRRGLPLDGIIQDWFYWAPAPWGSHHFDPVRYPDPRGMMQAVHDQHAHIIISVWAKFAPGSANRAELEAKGLLLAGTGDDLYYDPFNPLGRQVYWRQMRDELFSTRARSGLRAPGVDGWWLDASEPETDAWFRWSETDGVRCFLGPAARFLNAYPLMHTTGVYQGQRATTSDKRVFILTRSAWAGQQRNAAVTWSGDIFGDWQTLRDQIPAGLNFCLSGIPYWNTDIGGFISGDPATPEYRELFVRWFQFGAFCPMFRVHGTSHPKEMWRFGAETERILARYDALRYRLLPYLYSLAWRVTHEGYTLMRGLVMDFRGDPRVYDLRDQFMFGPALLVNPVTTPGAQERRVYLPRGGLWTDFWSGAACPGGRTVDAPAPLDTLPLFVRAGSILPLGPQLQYAAEKPENPVELRVYAGADGAFTLYEDQGDGYAYEKGVYATIPMTYTEASKTLTLGARRGAFPGMLARRTFHVVWVRPGHGVGLEPEASPDAVVQYDGGAVTVRAN